MNIMVLFQIGRAVKGLVEIVRKRIPRKIRRHARRLAAQAALEPTLDTRAKKIAFIRKALVKRWDIDAAKASQAADRELE